MKRLLYIPIFLIILNIVNAQTWVNQSHPEYMGISFPDDDYGWAVGYIGGGPNIGLIEKTTNAGRTWIRQYSGNPGTEISSVYFFDTTNGWACGGKGLLLKTTDGGINWVEQTSGTSYFLIDMHWLDTQTGWIVTNTGSSVLRTTDGGINWAISYTGPGELTSIFFVNADKGWVTGGPGIIRVTTDGGNTWSNQTSGFSAGPLWGIYFIDSLKGWVVGGNYDTISVILKTTDGGINWVQQTNPIGHHLMDVYFFHKDFGFAVGYEGTIINTTNGGDDWLSVGPLKNAYNNTDALRRLFFRAVIPGKAIGWICGTGLSIYYTPEFDVRPEIDAVLEGSNTPISFGLSQNYPNPFNPNTTIEYQIPQRGNVEIGIYDVNGLLVKTLLDTEQFPGNYSIQWDGKSDEGIYVSSGTYFYQVKSDNVQLVRKMLLLK